MHPMKGTLALLAAATTLGFAPTANAFPGDPLDFVYVQYLSRYGVTVSDDMTEAAGNFARQICIMTRNDASITQINALVHRHFDNVGPMQTTAIESGALVVYCPESDLPVI